MRIGTRSGFVIVVWVLLGGIAWACLWDSETLRQERSRFPSVLELITGKFPHYSLGFYEWRNADRRTRLEQQSTPELYDDLAVGLDKVGDQAAAIALMEECERRFPGRYETAANQGTFYFHSGRFAEGIPHIQQALEINPDAHFGREVYQLRLVEYLIERQGDNASIPLPLGLKPGEKPYRETNFFKFLTKDLGYEAHQAEVERAMKGVSGMMRFGHHDSPILLEALGDLLSLDGHGSEPHQDAKQLAARAYLQASYVTADKPEVSRQYRQFATDILGAQRGGTGEHETLLLEELEAQFQQELRDAETWLHAREQQEQQWLAAGLNLETEYARLEAAESEPEVLTVAERPRLPQGDSLLILVSVALLAMAVLGGVGIWLVIRFLKRSSTLNSSHEH